MDFAAEARLNEVKTTFRTRMAEVERRSHRFTNIGTAILKHTLHELSVGSRRERVDDDRHLADSLTRRKGEPVTSCTQEMPGEPSGGVHCIEQPSRLPSQGLCRGPVDERAKEVVPEVGAMPVADEDVRGEVSEILVGVPRCEDLRRLFADHGIVDRPDQAGGADRPSSGRGFPKPPNLLGRSHRQRYRLGKAREQCLGGGCSKRGGVVYGTEDGQRDEEEVGVHYRSTVGSPRK